MPKVIYFDGVTRLDIDPDRVLEAAVGELADVVVFGVDNNGEEFFASSCANAGNILLMLERCKQTILDATV